MSLPKYPEYKDSGVSWLGEVPAHWRVDRFKNVVRLRQEIVGNKASDYLLLSLTLQGVIPRDMDNPQGKFPSSFDTYQVVKKGDVVFCLFDVEETPRGVGLCNEEGMLTGAYTVVRPLDAFDSRFVFYYYYARDQYKAWRMYYTGLRNVIRWDNFCSIPFLAPSLEEQREISDFLDRETAKIDALIAEQEKLIALLAEKRQATISRAVTRGLDPNVPLKDSGVPWLGKVPAHWEVCKIKHQVLSIEQGWSPQCENFPVESSDEWGVLKVGCVNGGIFNAQENKKLPAELNPLPEYSLRKGDLLISRANTRELVGSAAVVHHDFSHLMLCDKLYRLRIRPSQVMPDFVSLYLGTKETRSQIELEATGASSSMLNIGQSVILDLLMPLPSLEEQSLITSFITAEVQRFNQLLAESTHAISLLKERRAALISAAVTGKIDVRGLAA